MRKLVKFLVLMFAAVCISVLWTAAAQKETLTSGLIRLHVVADSNSEADQAIKLKVRDAVLEVLEAIENSRQIEEARQSILELLPKIKSAADKVLEAAGCADRATVTLCREEFPMREYDSFSLPSGIYESLRVTIGSGEGRNWWCVVFPKLCVSAGAEDFEDTAVAAGFSSGLSRTLAGDEEYTFSFFLLDLLGKVENFFHFR